MQMSMRRSPSGLFFTQAALIVMTLLWISPASWLFMTAFDPAASGAFKLPDGFTLDHFAAVLQRKSGVQFINSMLISAGTATFTVFVAGIAAYPFSRLNIPFKNGILWVLVLLRILPPVAIMIPVFLTARITGLLNIPGVVLALTILNLPFAVLLLKNFFDAVPIELEEAAYMEGATLFQIITKVIAPVSRAGIAVVWFMTFTASWNEFLFPYLLLRTDASFPMSVGLYSAFGANNATNYGFLAAYSVIYLAPAVIVYFLLRRNLTTGFAGVGVKG
ncbi:MAG: carbohydrate ABC transporter permease [Alphaproteobacteria bacterium]|nr:carbohydrate ABC transporter permease [Alphaproteobacteria bacterium]